MSTHWTIGIAVATIIVSLLCSIFAGVCTAKVTVRAEQERQELLLKQSLHEGVLEALVLVSSGGSGAMFLVEAEKGLIHGTDPVVEALADSRIKLLDYLRAKKEAETDSENAKVNEAKALEDWDNARVALLFCLRQGLQSDTGKTTYWMKTKWPALSADLAEVERVLLLRRQ